MRWRPRSCGKGQRPFIRLEAIFCRLRASFQVFRQFPLRVAHEILAGRIFAELARRSGFQLLTEPNLSFIASAACRPTRIEVVQLRAVPENNPAFNPFYRWMSHSAFPLVYNAIMHWNAPAEIREDKGTASNQ